MSNDLVIVNMRRAIARCDIEGGYGLAAQRSRAGWVMVPGLVYRAQIKTAVATQFSHTFDLFDKRQRLIDEDLLDLMEVVEDWIIEDIQHAAYQWGCAEVDPRLPAVSRGEAENRALDIIEKHFNQLNERIADAALLDALDLIHKRILLAIEVLEQAVNRAVSRLVLGWT
jgi:hypothetical protein